MKNNYLSIDISLRHGAIISWIEDTPNDVIIFNDKEKKDYFDNIDSLIQDIFYLQNKEKCYNYNNKLTDIFIEKPILHGGPNAITIAKLLSFVNMFSYALYEQFNIKPVFFNSKKIKTYIVGSQPQSVNKKEMVEEKMLKKYLKVFEKLPNKKRITNNGKTIYDRKYRGNISDCADSLSVGLYGINKFVKNE